MEGESSIEDDAKRAVVPKDVKQLRACLMCHLVKHVKQFEKEGCDNCKDRFERENVDDFASVNFTGVAAIMQPEQSWVGKWLKKQKLVPGCYALEVIGDRPGED
mmetsp:Transcript_3398/g.8615  ORF Transcript_3398/g.8615 Transcript_3398/m.8615 type:complete len:104 (-) Transcript_3398:51-362(-)|eukprot:CAMPEP_0206244914 /NCGR_PEP_ID=MMETSP0047_2-20121206/18418_1 /ASSEMBLY_ACC=CAM_ASM_000192 /TAXON_ID=195065 /ORGANISM="Chroomonas mesostigmatica_cf, Strain CCMP1168" /LENGTH=103 /DNA_ID=CAMNT_0053670179 /DNA_START=109 /DNA_END=420 /DNA_ORIENTATION=+